MEVIPPLEARIDTGTRLEEPVPEVQEVPRDLRPHEPIRCFEGTARPHEPFWQLRNAVGGAEPEMELYGYISEYSWFDDEITPKMFKDDLYRLGGGGPITVRMNSGGGDVIAASIMRTIIQDYPGRVTVRIDGLAASAATVVATAGDLVRIQDTAYYMIHDPLAVFLMAALNIEELARMTETLKSVKSGIVNAYEARTGLSRDRLGKMMTNETWLSAQESVDLGFADEVITGPDKKKSMAADPLMKNVAVVNALRGYLNVPAALRQPVNDPVAERLRAEVKILK